VHRPQNVRFWLMFQAVRPIEHLYDDGIAAGSDPALVVTDLISRPDRDCDDHMRPSGKH
jgi:hypothetical protein